MIELTLKQQHDNKIQMSLIGNNDEIAEMLLFAMLQREDLAGMVIATIPSFLDIKGLPRKGFCDVILKARGATNEERQKVNALIKSKK